MADQDMEDAIRREVARRLDVITDTPGEILKWDRDGDGVISGMEWDFLRQVVEAEVVRDLQGAQLEPDHDPDDTLETVLKEVLWEPAEAVVDEFEGLPILEVIDGRYEVLQQIGKGTQGKTYLGRADDGSYVAIKELRFDNLDSWKSLDLFEREAEVLAQLDHPRIPSFIESFHVQRVGTSRFFIVQEFVAGEGLDVLIARKHRFSDDEVRTLARSVLEVLTYLHQLNPPVVHRDLKPANLIRRADGQYVVVDFGGVQLVLHDDIGGSTIIGTTGYMPPEQLTGRAVPQSDLYALGATLIHVVTGVHPSQLPTSRLKLDWQGRANVDPQLGAFIDALIDPIVEDRPPSAGAAARRLSNKRAAIPADRAIAPLPTQRAGHYGALSPADVQLQAAETSRVVRQGDTLKVNVGTSDYFGTLTTAGVGIALTILGSTGGSGVLIIVGVLTILLATRFAESGKTTLEIEKSGRYTMHRGKLFGPPRTSTGAMAGARITGDAILLQASDGLDQLVGSGLPIETRRYIEEQINEHAQGR